jgi:hypothetical protein
MSSNCTVVRFSLKDTLMRAPSPLVARAALLLSAIAFAPAVIAAQSPQTIVVRATDYKFDAPATVPAGTITLRLDNAGNEVHHLWLVQLKQGHTYGDFLKSMDSWSKPSMPAWAVDVGGPNDVSAGMTASAIVSLEAGHYAMVCYVPAPDGRPHVMHGMIKELEVTTAGATAVNEPNSDITLRMTDYAFDLSKPITAGPRIIRIENSATQSHEVVIAQLRAGKTLRQALTWLNEGQRGASPVIAMGGASGLAQGRHQFIATTFEPGRYVFLCFIPDAKDGKPHTVHGMAREFTVSAAVASK